MKSIFKVAGAVTISVLALGSVQAQEVQDKPWKISGSVRGFYDDNIGTTPSGVVPGPQESFGFQVRPTLDFFLRRETTVINASYTYDMRYYENRSNSADHSHEFGLSLDHEFDPRFSLSIDEDFALAQEAELLAGGTPFRANGNNIRNTAEIASVYRMSELISFESSYANEIIDYEAEGPASLSALLDRMEHRAGANLRWHVAPTTSALLGYQFRVRDQRSNDPISGPLPRTVLPEERDTRSHAVFVGGDHQVTDTITAAARVGVQYTEYPNAAPGANNDVISPYADGNVSWEFAEASVVQFGVRHERTQTDIAVTAGNPNPTLDAETTTLYGNLNHQITGRLLGTLTAQWQRSTFEDGGANNSTDNLVLLGTTFEYEINPFMTAEAGYSYDRLDSDLANRSFTRNRVFVGMRFAY